MNKRHRKKIDESVEELFQYTRIRVTNKDIVEFSPGDPGYSNYVSLWKGILKTGDIPHETEFDLSEVIGLTGWSHPEEEQDPKRFRHYRRFTSAVGIVLLHYGNDSESVRPANYLARDLIVDLNHSDPEHLLLLRKVFPVTKAQLIALDDIEYPFFTFGEMILAQIAGDYEASYVLASTLIEEEAAVRKDSNINYLINDGRFLLGLTGYDQLHTDWVNFSRDMVNLHDHDDMQYVIDKFLKM